MKRHNGTEKDELLLAFSSGEGKALHRMASYPRMRISSAMCVTL